MRALLSRLLGRGTPPLFDAPLAPAEPLAVIGDVHGCDAALARLLDRLEAEHPDRRIILVGDYIDRGEESAAVLRRLATRTDLTCLMGNHEVMCLQFLENPEEWAARWLRNGGLQTLASFGVAPAGATTDAGAMRATRDALAAAMGPDLLAWLATRPLRVQSGNVAVVHAGADPAVPIDLQDDKVLLWGHPKFDTLPRPDGIWIVHGHTVVDEPRAEGGRIAVDTGAYATGRLTAALIDTGRVAFLAAPDKSPSIDS